MKIYKNTIYNDICEYPLDSGIATRSKSTNGLTLNNFFSYLFRPYSIKTHILKSIKILFNLDSYLHKDVGGISKFRINNFSSSPTIIINAFGYKPFNEIDQCIIIEI